MMIQLLVDYSTIREYTVGQWYGTTRAREMIWQFPGD
jgi:hypothetical protein